MKRILLVCIIAGLVGCQAWWNKEDDDGLGAFKGMSAKKLYIEAKKAVTDQQYNSASKRLEALESVYPFSPYSEKGQRLLIYVYYKAGEYHAAAAEADHYIRLYPRSPHADYGYYMKGLAKFQQPRSALGRWIPVDESWRDPGTQTQAYADLLVFIEKFPKSPYYADALQRLIYLRNQFAQYELHNARYYFERDMYVAAAGRANRVVQTYPQAPALHDALVILYRSYSQLHLTKSMKEAALVYQATYQRSIKNAKLENTDTI